jgi:hypothetical protein
VRGERAGEGALPGGRAALLPGADVLAFVDIDSQQKRVYGHAKQGAAFGHTKIQGKSLLVRGLDVLVASICTPLAAPVIAATRLRGGSTALARGAASMITEGVATVRDTGCSGTLIVRMDSAFYGRSSVNSQAAIWSTARAALRSLRLSVDQTGSVARGSSSVMGSASVWRLNLQHSRDARSQTATIPASGCSSRK